MHNLAPAPPAPVGGRPCRGHRRCSGAGSCEATVPEASNDASGFVPNDEGSLLDWFACEFKTQECDQADNVGTTHDHRCCPFFHNRRDRRRPALVGCESGPVQRYFAEPCQSQFDNFGHCQDEDDCKSCHNTGELLYHPDLFRTRLCNQERCPRKRFCSFAHSPDELSTPLFGDASFVPTHDFAMREFKTRWCPLGNAHNWDDCVYAHTYRDFRRSPHVGYVSHPCMNWSRTAKTDCSRALPYEQRCFRGFACPFAHGAREQFYHPSFYKVSPCNRVSCNLGALCAYSHSDDDKRLKPSNESNEHDHAARTLPLDQAETLLTHLQPYFRDPPKYHTLGEQRSQRRSLWKASASSGPKSSKSTKHRQRSGVVSSDMGAIDETYAAMGMVPIPMFPCAHSEGMWSPAPYWMMQHMSFNGAEANPPWSVVQPVDPVVESGESFESKSCAPGSSSLHEVVSVGPTPSYAEAAFGKSGGSSERSVGKGSSTSSNAGGMESSDVDSLVDSISLESQILSEFQ